MLNLVIRTTLAFFILLILTRLLGKKQLSQLTFFNYVTGITIGSISANIVIMPNKPFNDEFFGLIWWCFLTYIVGFLGLKFSYVRRVVDGQPTIVIKKGRIDKKALQRTRLNIDDLSMLLREKNAFSVAEVDYAILEPDGKISVLKKQDQQQVTKLDLNVPTHEAKYFPAEIITDGNIVKKNLKEFNLNEEWLDHQLKAQNIKSAKEILYAEIQSDGSLYVDKY